MWRDARFLIIVLFILLLVGCMKRYTDPAERALRKQAEQLAQKLILVDGHIDVPHRLHVKSADISKRTKKGDFDYPRARRGGLNAPFMSIYIPAKLQKGGAYERGKKLIGDIEMLVNNHPDKFRIARTPADVRSQFNQGVISLPLGMENGAPIEGSMTKLREFYDLGVRYITLTHAKWNHISDSSYDDDKHWQGLSPFGKKLVREMNRLGIMVDVSHLSDQAFWQVIKLSKSPVIASHSSCRAFVNVEPFFERNMSDAMIRALAKNGGLIMINFGSIFLTTDANLFFKDYMKRTANLSKKEKKRERKQANKNFPFASIEDVANHIDHVVKLVGVDYVGLGSDFDGVGDSLPTDLKDVSHYPNLIYELLKRGYTEEQIAKISGENLLRVWQQNIEVAARSK